MGKKTTVSFIAAILITFGFTTVIQSYHPSANAVVDFDDFPLQFGDWHGQRAENKQYVLEMLNPDDLFNATYVNSDGIRVQLLFDYFSGEGDYGGPHSPRNCLPGSGWVLWENEQHEIPLGDRTIPANRVDIRFRERRQVMDFWYITRNGETANDYMFKIFELTSSLTFRPRDIGFVRFTANNTPESLAALDEFERLVVPVIYDYLPFVR